MQQDSQTILEDKAESLGHSRQKFCLIFHLVLTVAAIVNWQTISWGYSQDLIDYTLEVQGTQITLVVRSMNDTFAAWLTDNSLTYNGIRVCMGTFSGVVLRDDKVRLVASWKGDRQNSHHWNGSTAAAAETKMQEYKDAIEYTQRVYLATQTLLNPLAQTAHDYVQMNAAKGMETVPLCGMAEGLLIFGVQSGDVLCHSSYSCQTVIGYNKQRDEMWTTYNLYADSELDRTLCASQFLQDYWREKRLDMYEIGVWPHFEQDWKAGVWTIPQTYDSRES